MSVTHFPNTDFWMTILPEEPCNRGIEIEFSVQSYVDPHGEFGWLVAAARAAGEVVQRPGFPVRDLVLVRRVRTAGGRSGFLVGRVPRDLLTAQLRPILVTAAWLVASTRPSPRSRSWFANSTMRIEFFVTRPTSIPRPILL